VSVPYWPVICPTIPRATNPVITANFIFMGTGVPQNPPQGHRVSIKLEVRPARAREQRHIGPLNIYAREDTRKANCRHSHARELSGVPQGLASTRVSPD
jgi:hypothetical protein